MGMPVNNGTQHPVIAQVPGEGKLFLKDRGDWSTQDDGREHLDRVAVQWFRQHIGGGWESVSPGIPGQRDGWDYRAVAEEALTLGLGPENAGRKFRALVAVGYGPARYEDGTYVEWGHTRSVHTGEMAYSNELVVQSGRWARPDEPPQPTSRQVRDQIIALVKPWEAQQSGPIDATRLRIIRRIAEAPDRVWNPIKEEFRMLLDSEGREE